MSCAGTLTVTAVTDPDRFLELSTLVYALRTGATCSHMEARTGTGTGTMLRPGCGEAASVWISHRATRSVGRVRLGRWWACCGDGPSRPARWPVPVGRQTRRGRYVRCVAKPGRG